MNPNLRIEGRENAPWLVLIHSIGTCLEIWDDQVTELRRQYRVLRYDVRGHGKTAASQDPCTMVMLADDLLGLLASCGIARAHLVGVSIGGLIALAAALRGGDTVTSIAVCNSRCAVPQDYAAAIVARNQLIRARGMTAIADAMLNTSLTPATREARPELAAKLHRIFCSTSVEGFVGCSDAVGGNQLGEQLHAMRVPALFLAGDQDPAFPLEAMRAEQVQVPGANFAVIPSAGHLSNLDQPDTFNAIVHQFIGSVR
jgi:3-oxoadipate enol-lactonase